MAEPVDRDPSWDEIFRSDPGFSPGGDRVAAPTPGAERHAPPPRMGVAAAADEARRTPSAPVFGRFDEREEPPRRRRRGRRDGRRPRRWGLLVFLLVFLLVVGGTGVALWNTYGDRIQQALGLEETDYTGTGEGTKVDFVINSGDIGETVARNLATQGVTKTFTAPYRILLKDPSISFEPGTYTLQKRMSAKSAIAALRDAKNRLVNKAVIVEGSSAKQAFQQLSVATKIPVADFEAAAQDYVALGVPANAPSIEGFLFPATYQFDPGVTATDVLKRLVGEMNGRLDKLGVAAADRFRVVTFASVVQREAGSTSDMPKIARVFQNRLDTGMRLQSDATVAYGTGNTDRVTTTDSERGNAANRYNTYANPGLPVGPIGLPGEAAIESVLKPADGSWLYFVAVNLKTGETVFSTTQAEHDAAVRQWQNWCRQSDENRAYCR
ncbi:MAG: endolytic transglycosylase MltG [Micrococcales bacterium]|nr:endolytic transglycosylase MltG [Micrococcales bacterium]